MYSASLHPLTLLFVALGKSLISAHLRTKLLPRYMSPMQVLNRLPWLRTRHWLFCHAYSGSWLCKTSSWALMTGTNGMSSIAAFTALLLEVFVLVSQIMPAYLASSSPSRCRLYSKTLEAQFAYFGCPFCPAGHPNRSSSVNVLISAVMTRSKQDGQREDLDGCFKFNREPLALLTI